MESETNYEIIPVNHTCSKIINNTVVTPQPGSLTEQHTQNINDLQTQQSVNSQYDTIKGGSKNRHFKIISVNGENVKLKGRVNIKQNSSPLNAAKKLLSSYSKHYKMDNSQKTDLEIIFKIKETTISSKRKEYGPYIGYYYKYSDIEAKNAMFAGITPQFKPIVKIYQ